MKENSSPGDYLREMQCMWFELEIARTYRRLKKYGDALKKCHEIVRFFNFQLEKFCYYFSIFKSLLKINLIFIHIVFVKWCYVLMLICSILKII
jgi:hypothetical protein